MIEAAMYVALGFCSAGLICLAILPSYYRRAARLTEEALRAVNPMTYAEVRAAQDQARARHAVDLRRVERQLDREREISTGARAELSRLKTEMARLEEAQGKHQAEFEKTLAHADSDSKAMDLLTAEVAALQAKLTDAEKALADSWTREPAPGAATADGAQADQADAEWLPESNTMTLAMITGLEAEVATLKAKLAKYEPIVAGEVAAERTEMARTRLAELEAKLVDTESKYIAAQAEVTRLSIQLDSADIGETELQKKLTTQLEKLAEENARHQAELKGKERRLDRLTGQIGKLQQDLASTASVSALRDDFRSLVRRIAAEENPQPAAAKTRSRKKTPQATEQPAAPKTRKRPRKTGTRKYEAAEPALSSAPDKPAASKAASEQVRPAPETPAKTSDIATAAEALVSRIIASNRGQAKTPPPKAENAEQSASKPNKGAQVAQKADPAEQESVDVA